MNVVGSFATFAYVVYITTGVWLLNFFFINFNTTMPVSYFVGFLPRKLDTRAQYKDNGKVV